MTALASFRAADLAAYSPEIRKAFKTDGVVVLKSFASAAECAALKARAFDLIDAFDFASLKTVFSTTTQSHATDDYFLSSGGDIRCFLEEGVTDATGALIVDRRDAVNKIGHALHDLDPVFADFSRSEKMRAAAHVAGFDDPLLLQSMVIMKSAKTGGEVTCHQDSTFLYTEPESCVGFWLALDEATEQNGCLEFIPGEHEKPLRRLFKRKPEGGTEMVAMSDEPYPEDRRVMAPAAIGDLVIFSGRTPHMSRANRSALPRMAYTLHMISAAARYPDWNWLQRPKDMPLKGF